MSMIQPVPRGGGRRVPARRMAPRRAGMRGISLIEVMVSVVIIAIGLLGIAAMQSVALRGSQSSLEISQAVIQTNSILEAIRANRANAAAYNMAMTCALPAGGALAANDQRAWLAALKNTIGQGEADDTTTCGQITDCANACVITVQWDDQRAGGGAARQVVTETRI